MDVLRVDLRTASQVTLVDNSTVLVLKVLIPGACLIRDESANLEGLAWIFGKLSRCRIQRKEARETISVKWNEPSVLLTV